MKLAIQLALSIALVFSLVTLAGVGLLSIFRGRRF